MQIPFKSSEPQTRFDLDRLAREAVDTLPKELRTDPPGIQIQTRFGVAFAVRYVAGTGRLELYCPSCGNLAATIAVAAFDATEGGTSDV